jgi:peroxiredoxin Q/BCP
VDAVLDVGREHDATSDQTRDADQGVTRTHDSSGQDTQGAQVWHGLLAVMLARVTTTDSELPKVGQPAPDFTLPSTDDTDVSLSSFKGKQAVVLYFYPKDDTPGCTREACSFRDLRALFNEHGAEILGVSPDTVKSHKKFQEKFHLTFPLLADNDHAVAEQYGVWQQKKFMGRQYMGIARTTFVVDKDGVITAVFPNVKVEGHAQKVLDALKG